MKKALIIIAGAASAIATLATAPVSASGAMGNIGSIVFASDSCSDMGSTAFGNIGSIVGLSGGGNCDANEVISHVSHNASANGNIGSIVVDNACGGSAFGNIGSIVLTNSGDKCHPSQPTTIIVTKRDQPVQVAAVTPVAVTKPAELPATGAGSVIGIGAGVTALGYVASLLRKKHLNAA